MTILLSFAYLVLLVLISPWILWRSVTQGRYRRGWRERLFGLIPTPIPDGQRIWFHAVSVGELQVLRPVIEALERERPDLVLCISTSTDSGMTLAEKLYSKHVVFFSPLDVIWAVRNVARRLQPKLLVLVELELWPNLVWEVARSQCKIAIINARLGEKSFRGYRRLGWLVSSVLSRVDWIGCQSQSYRDRFQQLGVLPERLAITGNIKFDGATGDRNHSEVIRRRAWLQLEIDSLVLLAGSTQSPEEAMMLDVFQTLAPTNPKLRLILVPRHAERFDEVASRIAASGLRWSRRSESVEVVARRDWQVFLADSIGELRWWWGLADIGFVGGSFGDRGGQNMIEPCAYGVATSFGPNTKNFADIVHLLRDAQACEQFAAPEQVQPWIEAMIHDPTRRIAMSERAIEVTRQHRGALQKTLAHLHGLLPDPTNMLK